MQEKELKDLENKYFGDVKVAREGYKRLFDRGLELVKQEQFPKELFQDILEEYASRLEEMPGVEFSIDGIDDQDIPTKEKLKSLILFGAQAVLIRDNSIIQHELKLANSSYEEVLGIITHEFKNLLTSIYGYNRIMKKHLPREGKEELTDILSAVERLTKKLFNMVDSLLKMSLGEKGLLKPDFKLIDFVGDVLKPVEMDLKSQLIKKNMQFKEFLDNKAIMLLADEELLAVAVRNLLDNAIKYGNEKSEIEIAVHQNGENLAFSVKNKGQGIPDELRKGIFEKFKRADVGNVKGGTGLGLYNVKNISSIHNGEVKCDSKPGAWAKFSLLIPLNLE